jgi:hypothetical protein
VEYFAHSIEGEPEPSDRWQTLADHLPAVAELAERFANAARPGDAEFTRAA